jgi:hypothetical protein
LATKFGVTLVSIVSSHLSRTSARDHPVGHTTRSHSVGWPAGAALQVAREERLVVVDRTVRVSDGDAGLVWNFSIVGNDSSSSLMSM